MSAVLQQQRGRLVVFDLVGGGSSAIKGAATERLVDLFETKLGFVDTVPVCCPTSTKSAQEIFLDVSGSDFGDCLMLVCVVFTRGNEDALVCSAEGGVISTRTILRLFDETNCPALRGKTKVFILQGCQTDAEKPDKEETVVSVGLSPIPFRDFIVTFFFRGLADDEADDDWLFVRTLCDVIEHCDVTKTDVMTVLRMTAGRVMESDVCAAKDGSTRVPCIISSTEGRVYFKSNQEFAEASTTEIDDTRKLFTNVLEKETLSTAAVIETSKGNIESVTASSASSSNIFSKEMAGASSSFSSDQQMKRIMAEGRTKEDGPYVKILIQPAQKAVRFRYAQEWKAAGLSIIPGANSTPQSQTYPTIQIMQYKGPVEVAVSCVTKDEPYRPHPHRLKGCHKGGICLVAYNNEDMTFTFSNLGIERVKRKDIEGSLVEREKMLIDLFKTGFAHKYQKDLGNIDLSSVRLCFQAFVSDPETNRCTIPLKPVVSDPIFDRASLVAIRRLIPCSASVSGGTEVVLFCDKISSGDVQVRFYELDKNDGGISWEAFGEFEPHDVHKQVAILFRTPQYRDIEISEPVEVFVQLRRISDGAESDPISFQFVPDSRTGSSQQLAKRRKINVLGLTD